jgi:hypothetical protein
MSKSRKVSNHVVSDGTLARRVETKLGESIRSGETIEVNHMGNIKAF